MLAVALSILIGILQASETGTILGLVKDPGAKTVQSARVLLLPPKYTDMWNRQVQQRLDNYWEIYKADLLANKDHVETLFRLAHVESLRYVTTTMQHELGGGAPKYIKDALPGGQFEFRGIPFGTYQLVVQTTSEGQEVTWSRIVEVQSNIPIFVDLGKPVS